MKKDKPTDLRKQAEGRLKNRFDKLDDLHDGDPQRLIHELRVHQIELEMQNEALRKSQTELEESRAKYSDLYDFAPAGYFTFDNNGLIIEVNLTGAGQLGVERNLLTRKPFSSFIHKEDQDIFFLHRRQVLETKTLQTCELRLKRKNGDWFYAQLESIALKDSDSCCRTTVIDISKRKLAEAALLETQQLNELLLDSVPHPTMLIRLDRTILAANKIAREAGAVVGEPCWQSFGHAENISDEANLYLKKHCGENSPSGIKCSFCLADEATGSSEATVPHKPANCEVTAFGRLWDTYWVPLKDGIYLHYSIDITERKQVEEERERLLKELEQSNRALELYSSAISFDLRAPLRSIDGFAQAILDDYKDKLDEAGKDYLNRVISASKRMSQLIDALLTMASLVRAEIKEDTFSLSEIAQVIAYELKKREPERQVEFIIAEKVRVKGDVNLLRMVIENLFDNAYKFTGKHPSARIEFGVYHPFNSPPNLGGEQGVVDKDVYFVRDDGAGFDMSFVDKLFSPFSRLHRDADFPGIGIGLAMVHKIIKKHGGKIWVESAPEKGATFYFTLG